MSNTYPTSSAQSRTWFLERWLPGTSQYHIGQAWRLEGELSLPALTAALQALVARHESLRTGFVEEGGEPLQRIVEMLDVAPRVIDLTAMPAAEQDAQLGAALTQAFEEPFDLSTPPLLRVVVWQLAPGRQVMLIVEHHIITDGWSRGIMRKELGEFYGRALRGELLALPPLPLQYADYALWQREVMAGEEYRAALAQWQARLSGLEPLELPTDRPRAAEVDYTGGLVQFSVAPALTASLKALARAHGATLYMVLLAVMQVLLMRLSGQRDIAVGSPVAGRGRAELEGLVGFFVNTLVLRTEVEPEESFATLLARVREGALDAYGRAEVPFEELVRVLNPARDASRHPLFQVLLALQNLPPVELSLAGLAVHETKVPRTTTKFDLSMTLMEREGGMVGTLEYASALFEAETMQRWAGHYLTLLEGVVGAPETPVSRLPLLTAAERAQLWAWNDTATGDPVQETLHGEFEAQVRAAPEALAVVGEGGQLTYAALDARAEAVARGLRGLGVEVGTRVGVCLPRSLDLVVGVLGILKAGGVYVPLDPTYPASRLQYMVEDAGLALVLAPEAVPTSVLSTEVRSISVSALATMPGPAEWPCGGPRDPAYVIYTSGSTGHPKGVLISHGAVCTHLPWLRELFGFGPRDRLLMRASPSFDASVWELFSALHSGASVVLARSASDMDPEVLAMDIRQHEVTAFMAVPSMLSALLAENLLSDCSSLRLAFSGGEALAVTTVNAFNAQSTATLLNLYGPTEHSIWATWWRCPRGNVESTLIGRPIPPVEAWVFDEQGELSPEGIPGELYLGGAGLAEGYLNRPELTAEKFVPHPFKPGARLYRTGDRVRWRPDGNLEFLGRLDAQVKLRGYRIELGEIEAALLAEGAAQAAVILREDRGGDPRLVAYVAGVTCETDALRDAMRLRLPDFMVPSVVVVLQALPRTPNGKLDRKALPAPGPLTGSASRPAPETETEQALAVLWGEVLGVEQISREDDFFALGGHSLLLHRLRAHANARFSCMLGLRDLFVTPVLKDQAALIERARNLPAHPAPDASSTPIPALRSRDRSAFRRASNGAPPKTGAATEVGQVVPPQVEREYPASFAQERMWMRAQARTGGAPNTVNFAWRLQGRPDLFALQAALAGLIIRHATLRTSLALEGDALMARVHRPMPASLDIRMPDDPSGYPNLAVLQRDFLMQPSDAAAPCQLRARLLALAPDDSLLLLAINHIAADGFSQSLLQRDFSHMYAAALEGGQAALPVPGSHALFAQHQRKGTGDPSWLEARRWWQSRLASPPRLSLPLLRSHLPQGEGDQVSLTLSASSWREIGEFSRTSGVSTFTVCLTALTSLLHRLGGQRDLLIGTPVAHRDNPAFHELVGCCLNDLALRIGVPGNATGQDLLGEVAARKRESFAHRDIPIEQVISDLGLQGATGRHPLFDVMFNMIPWPAPSMELPGLAVTRLAAWQLETPFDLCFYLNRQPSFYESEELAGEPGVRLFLLFRRGRLARDDAQLMLAQFADLIVQLVRDPQRRLTDYALVQPDVVAEADAGQNEPSRSAEPKIYPCVISAVREQCRLSPEATAIEQGSERLTYAGLAAMVERLVAQFVEAGVIKGDVLALCLPRSPAFVAAILASLRVGAVVMPLEGDTPPARLNAAMRHAHWRLSPGQGGGAGWQLECLHEAARRPESRPSPARSSGADSALAPADPAYLFFTSGSTGEPKGILGRYAGLCQFIAWQTATFGINAQDRVSGLTSLGFDPVLREIFLPLVNGGTLCLPPADLVLDEEPVWLAESGITVVHFVPSRLRAWLSSGEMCAMPSLRLAIFSGEVLHGELVESFRQFLADGCSVINFYGPTETTMIKSWYEVPIPASPGVQPIGRALWNTEILVIDTEGRVCGAGEAGELVIRTAYASLGYLGDMRDAWRFSPDPKQPGVREISYRTGDLGCRDARGILHILGRLDHQVKINGVRIEPESVESVLASHPAVRACAVVNAPVEGEQEPGLVAWIVPVGQMPELGSLRRFLAEWLQPAAIPGVFAPLAALPILPNGKIDRAELSRRSVAQPADMHGRTAPADPTERALAAVWKSLLPAVDACREDDFFALGGNSLLGMRLINRLQLEFGVEAGLRDLFAYPSLQEMAAWLRSQHAKHAIGDTP